MFEFFFLLKNNSLPDGQFILNFQVFSAHEEHDIHFLELQTVFIQISVFHLTKLLIKSFTIYAPWLAPD